MKYASLDIETTGLDPNTHQITELAVVIDDLANPKPVDELPYYSSYVGSHPSDLVWSMPALLMFKDRLQEYNDAYKIPVSALISEITKCIMANTSIVLHGEKITFAGKNFASFDRTFLNVLPGSDWLKRFTSHRSFDPGSMYYQVGDKNLPSTEICMQRAGIKGVVSHRALDDARNVIRLIRFKQGISII